MRILIIEDDPKISSFLKKGFKEVGYAADVAANGEAGLSMTRQDVYDGIVADLMLPKLNALKYTPDGGRVSIEVGREPETATLTVSDTGPGIPAEELDRVFEQFYRVGPSRTVPGHGLGLNLVKAFTTACGGNIKINSAAGAGCTITIKLPLSAPHD